MRQTGVLTERSESSKKRKTKERKNESNNKFLDQEFCVLESYMYFWRL